MLSLHNAPKKGSHNKEFNCGSFFGIWFDLIYKQTACHNIRKKYKPFYMRASLSNFGHKWLAFQSVRVRVVDWHQRQWPLKTTLFFIFSFFLLCRLFSKKKCSNKKTCFAKVDGSAQKISGRHLSRPCRPFWAPQCPFQVLQVVRHGKSRKHVSLACGQVFRKLWTFLD